MPSSPATPHPRIALVTEHRFLSYRAAWDDPYLANLLHEDRLLQAALARRGVDAQRVAWDGPEPGWGRFAGAVLRSTWNYSQRAAEFGAWLERLAGHLPLCNPLPYLRWNLDKAYLADLESAGLPVLPTHYLEAGDTARLETIATSHLEDGATARLEALLDHLGWEELVLKPRISAGGRLTRRLAARDLARWPEEILAGLEQEPFILQPFQPAVQTEGEDSLMLLGGRYSHAVRKRPRAGDFRVQDDYGGSVARRHPEPAQRALAEAALAAAARHLDQAPPAYGRVDLLRGQDGSWRIIELELLEPELWLRQHPPAAEAFAAAVLEQLRLQGA